MNEQRFQAKINVLETKFKMKFSAEQLAVLRYDYQTPVLLNSCAGAGKTTLLMMSILMQMVNGVAPQNILAVTFSKKSQLDMAAKFNQYAQLLGLDPTRTPKFVTFDALFYRLLKLADPNLKVLTTSSYQYHTMAFEMRKSIVKHSNVFDDYELMTRLIDFRSQLINNQYTYDGLRRHGQKLSLDELIDFGLALELHYNADFYRNYMAVMETYNDLKVQSGYVDFEDLRMVLLKALRDPKKAQFFQQVMRHYQRLFIDEFQDVNRLQWNVVRQLMDPKALDHMGVIGDDDQSIYRFRGSDPDIILNLQQHYPNFKKFNLTTNYRTAGDVLKYVTPLIENNQYRLHKVLNIYAGNQNKGKLIALQGHSKRDGQSMLLQNVVTKLNDLQVVNSEVAVLCRNVIDIALASDYFFDAGYPSYVNHVGQILQNQPVYKCLMGVLKGLWQDDFSMLKKFATKIGFRSYDIHMWLVMKTQPQQTIKTVNDYLELIDDYNANHVDATVWWGEQLLKRDDQLRVVFDRIQFMKRNQQVNLDEIANLVLSLVQPYYAYMLKKGFMTETDYIVIAKRWRYKLAHSRGIDIFLDQEASREAKLRDICLNYNLVDPKFKQYPNLMTIHVSKGLEFDYVYLFNYRVNRIGTDEVLVNRYFAPNLTRATFLKVMVAIPDDQRPFNRKYAPFNALIDYVQKANANDTAAQWTKLQGQLFNTKVDYDAGGSNIAVTFANLYQSIKSISKDVEDERRLLYVALTRSRLEAYYNTDYRDGLIETTPLFKELATPDQQIMYQDPNGTLMAVKDWQQQHHDDDN